MKQRVHSAVLVPLLSLALISAFARAEELAVIQFLNNYYSVVENAGAVLIEVRRTGSMTDYAYAALRIEPRNASADDFQNLVEIVELTPRQSNGVIRIEILNDALVEGYETFDIVLEDYDPFCCRLGDITRATVEIVDNDLGLQFGSDYYSVAENAGELRISVSRLGDMTNEAGSVGLLVEQRTATPNVDFVLATNRLEFLPGQTNATISISLVNDAEVEGWEFLTLRFDPDVGPCCPPGNSRFVSVNIDDNDQGVAFSADSLSISEANPAPLIQLRRAGDWIGDGCFVTIVVSGTASNGVDYSLAETAFVFLPGETNVDVPVFVHNDALLEYTEVLSLTIVPDPFDCPRGARMSTSVFIEDNDPGVFVAQNYTVMENEPAATIDFWRLGDATNAFTVDLLVDGSAEGGADYVLATNRLHFAAGQTNYTLVLPLLDDPLVEDDEHIHLRLTNVTGGVPLGLASSCRVDIRDNEYPGTPAFWFPSNRIFTVENWTNAYVAVVRGGNSSNTLTVDFVASGSAAPGADFSPTAGTLTFNPLETVKYVALQLTDDCRAETNESIELVLTNASPSAIVLDPWQPATLWITDNDTPGSLDVFDPEFDWITFPDTNGSFYPPSTAIALQSDGKIVVGRNGVIARLNRDGSRDSAFTHGATICGHFGGGRFWFGMPLCHVSGILLEPDGHILAGGSGSIIRLDSTGVLDSNFVVTARSYRAHGEAFPGFINQLILQPDGGIVVFGTYSEINGTFASPVRLNADSTIDESFVTDGYWGSSAARLSDGRFLLAWGSLFRLHADGSRDEEFPFVLADGDIRVIAVGPDQRVLIGGQFSNVSNEYHRALARLNPDGSLDTGFNPVMMLADAGEITAVHALTITREGNMLLAGAFADGSERVLKIDSEGMPIPMFNSGLRFSGPVNSIIEEPSGEMLVAGSFESVNGIPRPGIARLKGERSHVHLSAPAVQPDGSVRVVTGSHIGGTYVLQASADLVAWTDISTNIATDCALQLQDANPGSARFYRVSKTSR